MSCGIYLCSTNSKFVSPQYRTWHREPQPGKRLGWFQGHLGTNPLTPFPPLSPLDSVSLSWSPGVWEGQLLQIGRGVHVSNQPSNFKHVYFRITGVSCNGRYHYIKSKVVNALFWPTRCAREQEQSLSHMSVWIKDIPISPSPNHPTAVIWITTSNHKHPLFHSPSSSPSSFPSIPATLLGNLQTLRLLSMHPTCSSDCGSGCPLPWWTGAGDVCWRQLYNGRDLSFRDYQGLPEILEPAPANGIVLPFCYHCMLSDMLATKNVKRPCLQNWRKATSWIVLRIPIFKTAPMRFCFCFTTRSGTSPSKHHKKSKHTEHTPSTLTSFVFHQHWLHTPPGDPSPKPGHRCDPNHWHFNIQCQLSWRNRRFLRCVAPKGVQQTLPAVVLLQPGRSILERPAFAQYALEIDIHI